MTAILQSKMKNKKGTTIVEASMIFPIVIAGVMAVLYIIIALYSSLSLQTSMHLSLRKESGELSETVYRAEAIKKFEFESDQIRLRPIITMGEEATYRIKGIFANKITRRETGRSYVIDEAEIVRIRSEVKEVLE